MDGKEVTGIAEAIENAGSQEALARIIGCSQQNISSWLAQGYVPVEQIVAVEQATGVPRMRLIKPKILELLTPPAL